MFKFINVDYQQYLVGGAKKWLNTWSQKPIQFSQNQFLLHLLAVYNSDISFLFKIVLI